MKHCLTTATVFLLALSLAPPRGKAQSVDMLTGRLQMSVPIGSLNANDITIPISIHNKGGSLRVAESENDCGMGWGLSAGGSISRLVKGLPDEYNTATKKGWLHNNNALSIQNFNPTADDNLGASCSDEAADWNFLQTHVGIDYVNDTEPDIFFIDAPGLSAKFVFGADGLPELLTYQDIVITANLPTSFTIKTNQGMEYVFTASGNYITRMGVISANSNEVPTECLYYKVATVSESYTITNQWNLTSITSGRTGTTATFHYLPASVDGAGKVYHTSDSLHYLHDVYRQSRLQSISLKLFKATFDWVGSLLLQVKIEELNSASSRLVKFNYFSASNTTSNVGKQFLRSLLFVGGNCLPSEVYDFDYWDVNYAPSINHIPSYINWKWNKPMDYFGYPNVTALPNKNNPQLYFYATESDGKRLRVDGNQSGFQVFAGDDRSVASTALFGALKKVTYPTGGYAAVEYENNVYYDNSVGFEFLGSGSRVKKITLQGGEAAFGKSITSTSDYRAIQKEYEYLKSDNSTTSGLLLSPIKLGYITQFGIKKAINNLGEEPMVFYSRVKEKIIGSGYTLYEYNLPGMFPETASGEWKATKSRIARKPNTPCLSVGNLRTGFYLYPYAPSSNYDFRRGTLSRTATYSQADVLVSEKQMTYTTLSKNPSMIKGIRFEKIGDIYYYGIYELLTGRGDVVSQEVVKEASQQDPTKLMQTTTSYTYNSNNFLQTVTTALPNGTVRAKYRQYAKDFAFSAPADSAAVAIKALNDANRGSEVVEEIDYLTLPGGVQTVTSASLVQYRDFGNDRIQPYYLKYLPPGAALTPSFVNGQTFSPDADYKTRITLKEYDNEGRVLTQVDDKRNYVANHYANDLSTIVATFANAQAQQAVFEGFEMNSSFGLSTTGAEVETAAGWTGEKAIAFKGTGAGALLVSSPTKLIQKNGNKYRVSCWAKSLPNKAVTFKAKVGAAEVASLTLTNTVNNQWNYLEGEMNTSSIAAPFSLEVSANATATEKVLVDDIVFMPATARVSLQTVSPLNGVTSTTDDLGNSTKITYDYQGKKVNTLDRKRNLVQKNEYAVKNQIDPLPSAFFLPSSETYFISAPYQFTPIGNQCDPATTYAWEVDGAGQASGANNVLSHVFTTIGVHNVKLTVTNSKGASQSYTLTLCVQYQFNGTISAIALDQNGNPITSYTCATIPIPQINPQVVTNTPIPQGCTLSVKWTTTVQVTGNTTVTNYIADYYIDCSAYKDCQFTNLFGSEGQAVASVTYVQLEVCP